MPHNITIVNNIPRLAKQLALLPWIFELKLHNKQVLVLLKLSQMFRTQKLNTNTNIWHSPNTNITYASYLQNINTYNIPRKIY